MALIAMDKNCGYDVKPIPRFEKPKEEEKKEDDIFEGEGY